MSIYYLIMQYTTGKTICIQNCETNPSLPEVLLYLMPDTRNEMVQSHLHSQQGLEKDVHDDGYEL